MRRLIHIWSKADIDSITADLEQYSQTLRERETSLPINTLWNEFKSVCTSNINKNTHQPDKVNRGVTVTSNDSAEGREGHNRQIGIGTTNYKERRKRPAGRLTTTTLTTWSLRRQHQQEILLIYQEQANRQLRHFTPARRWNSPFCTMGEGGDPESTIFICLHSREPAQCTTHGGVTLSRSAGHHSYRERCTETAELAEPSQG